MAPKLCPQAQAVLASVRRRGESRWGGTSGSSVALVKHYENCIACGRELPADSPLQVKENEK